MKINIYSFLKIFVFSCFIQASFVGWGNPVIKTKNIVYENMMGARPNIILFLADDQSISDHSVYGNKNAPTYVTEAFSKESLVFENAFTGQAICAPSRSMLFTGLYPLKNGCYINHTAIRKGVKTLPAYLREFGYDVLLVGKSHIKPADQFPWTKWIKPVKKEGYPRPAICMESLDSYLSSRENPFCLIIASEYPHGPYFKDSKFKEEEVFLPPFQPDNKWNRKFFGRYYTSIKEKENEFDGILKLVDKHGLRDQTIVFYADDHGMARGKFTVYKSGLNVAFMVRWPGFIKPGRTDALTSFADVVPTLIDLVKNDKYEGENNFDGKSLVKIFDSSTVSNHEYLFGVGNSQGIQNRHIFPQRSIYDGRYNYIYNFNSNERLLKLDISDPVSYYFYKLGADKHKGTPEEELYDTQVDPFEMNNIANEEAFALLKGELRRALFNWLESQNDYLVRSENIPFFKVWRPALDLDVQAPEFNYFISSEKVGSLKGRKQDPHDFGI